METEPCSPNPCGPNSVCRAQGSVAHCSCRPPMYDEPPSCRPECHSSADCPAALACRAGKCRDPCPGACGAHAICRTTMHSPICTCPPGYAGDPFIRCRPGMSIHTFRGRDDFTFWADLFVQELFIIFDSSSVRKLSTSILFQK